MAAAECVCAVITAVCCSGDAGFQYVYGLSAGDVGLESVSQAVVGGVLAVLRGACMADGGMEWCG